VAWSFGELEFERVVSITTEPNGASPNVMAKLGFVLHAQVPSEWGALWVHVLER
jgi:RimJ/RimL family protein N-acetyltransferase